MTNWLRPLVLLSPLLFPAYFWRFTLAGIPLTALEVFIYGLFGWWILTLFQPKKIYLQKPLPLYFLGAALFLFAASMGVLKTPEATRAALGVWKGWVIAPLLYFWVLTQSLTNGEQVRQFLRSFVHSAVLLALLSYAFALFGQGVTYDFRLAGFYESANYLALYLLPAAVLNMVWILERKRTVEYQHTMDTATLAILLHALFFTQSYAAILALFGALILYGLYVMILHRPKAKRAFMGILILIVTLLVIAVTQLQAPKFKQFLDVENRSSTTVRFEIYRVTWDLIENHWLWGVGPGLYQSNYQTRAPEVLGRAPLELNVPHPHNLFFAFWLNAGLLGLLSLLGFIWLAHRRFTYPLLAFWAIILHGFFDTPFWKNDLAMIFWAIIGAIALLQSYGTDSSQKPAAHPSLSPRKRRSRRAQAQSNAA